MILGDEIMINKEMLRMIELDLGKIDRLRIITENRGSITIYNTENK